jgi:NAD-dependent dihydropyrimidine dehydrogenase PreA subunit
MKRKIINIDQEKCTGCGVCVSDCPEGALQVIDGKARLVGDLLCDGLGACIQTCPENAISIEEREAEPYNEIKALENIIPQGPNVIQAHLNHLRNHAQTEYLHQALTYLQKQGINVAPSTETAAQRPTARQCPGSQVAAFPSRPAVGRDGDTGPSQLTHWPIQLHLASPLAPHYKGSDLLLAADCVAYSLAGFHQNWLQGRTLAIACPKLDTNQETYLDKLTVLIDQAEIKSIKVMIMQVPCCRGLLRLVVDAANRARNSVPITCVVVGLQGEILQEAPVETGVLQQVAKL